jgi:hypothetical protein
LHFRGFERSRISKFSGLPPPRRLIPLAFATPPRSENAYAVPGHRMTSHIFTISRLHARQESPPPPLVNLGLQHCNQCSSLLIALKNILKENCKDPNSPSKAASILTKLCSTILVHWPTRAYDSLWLA